MSQATEFSSNIDEQLSRWLGAIPVLMPILQRLNVVSIINRYCPCQADVDGRKLLEASGSVNSVPERIYSGVRLT